MNNPTLDDPEFGTSVQMFINPELVLDLTSGRSKPTELEEKTTFGEVLEYIIQCIDLIIENHELNTEEIKNWNCEQMLENINDMPNNGMSSNVTSVKLQTLTDRVREARYGSTFLMHEAEQRFEERQRIRQASIEEVPRTLGSFQQPQNLDSQNNQHEETQRGRSSSQSLRTTNNPTNIAARVGAKFKEIKEKRKENNKKRNRGLG